MDWDLWGPSYSEGYPIISPIKKKVASESCSQIQPGWQCDFYFGYGLDVIEEDALNEKSCVQVLRVLVSNADTEIEELEKDLVVLQSELAWAENREWSEICSTSLGEKINCLDVSIQSLKNENEHDINVDLLLHREPAERIHDIVKVLLRRYCPEEDEQEQFPVIIIKCSSSDMQEYATDLLDEKKNLSDLDFNIISKEGRKESSTTITEQFNIFNLSLQSHGTKDNHAEMGANMSIEKSSADTSSQGSGCSSENKKFSDSCLKIIKEEVQHVSTSTPAIIILESSWKPEGDRGEVDDRVEPSSTVEEDSRFNVLEHSTNYSDKKIKDSNTTGDSTLTDDYKILISSLKTGGRRKNYQKVTKPANVIVGNSNSESVRCEIGFNEKEKSYMSISRSDVSIQTNSGGDDIKLKSSKFPLKTVWERTVTGSKVAASKKIIAAKSSARPDRKSMIFQEAVISDNEHTAVNSFSELQGHVGKDTTKLHLQGGKPQTEKVQNAKAPAYDRESLSWSSIKPPKAKRKIKSNQLSIQEASLPPKTSGLNSSSASKSKRRRKSGTCKDNASLKRSLNAKILKNLVLQNNCGSDDPGLISDVNRVSVLLSQKRSQKSLKLPIHMEIEDSTTCKMPKLNVGATEGAGKEDVLIINTCSIDDSHDETIKSLPCSKPRLLPLEKMKLVELRAMAKQHNLTKYHKLRKDDLVQAIVNQQG